MSQGGGGDVVAQALGGPHGAARVVLVGLRIAEGHHQAIGQRADDMPAVAPRRLGEQRLLRVQELVERFDVGGVPGLGHQGEPAAEDGQLPSLDLERARGRRELAERPERFQQTGRRDVALLDRLRRHRLEQRPQATVGQLGRNRHRFAAELAQQHVLRRAAAESRSRRSGIRGRRAPTSRGRSGSRAARREAARARRSSGYRESPSRR